MHPLGGRGPPTRALFGENVCQNKRIGSHRGWRAPGTSPPQIRQCQLQCMHTHMSHCMNVVLSTYRGADDSEGKIDFYNDPNLCKVVGTFTKDNMKSKGENHLKPGILCGFYPDALVCVEHHKNLIEFRSINCNKSFTKFDGEIKMEVSSMPSDMVSLQNRNINSIVVACGQNGVASFKKMCAKPEWKILGADWGNKTRNRCSFSSYRW